MSNEFIYILASKDASMPDEMGGTVGIERYELLEKARGNLVRSKIEESLLRKIYPIHTQLLKFLNYISMSIYLL